MVAWCRRLVGVATLLVAAAAATGCAHQPAPRVSNLTDARYLLASRYGASQPPPTFVSGYRSLLRRPLGSRCRWYPSDSEYYSLRARSCSVTASLYLTFARIIAEKNIATLAPATSPVHIQGMFRWIQLPSSCP